MTTENDLRKHAGRDLGRALMLAKLTLTPEQQTELESLYARLDRLTAVEVVAVINARLDSGLALRPAPERVPIPVDDTAEDERGRERLTF